MRPPLLAATDLASALVWTIALIVDREPFEPAPAFLIAVGLLSTATVATVGMVVVAGRWAHRLAFAPLAITVVLATVMDIDFVWIVGTVATALAVIALLSPTLTATIRRLPAAAGPPPRAVIPALILLLTPGAIGLVGNGATPWALIVVGLSAPLAAFLYVKVVFGGLLGIRVVWPLMTLSLSPLLGWYAGPVAIGLAGAVAVSAWHGSVKTSYHPPREVGSTFPIPPELAPKEVLDAAQIDEKGRRR